MQTYIITQLMGGLGNQMFQYACARSLALKRNARLKVDLSFYRETRHLSPQLLTPRQYRLNLLNIPEIDYFTSWEKSLLPIQFFLNAHIHKAGYKKVVEKDTYKYQPEQFDVHGNLYLSGYWQNIRYFKEHRNIFQTEFCPYNSLSKQTYSLLTQIERTNSVSLHIRRGDYVTNPTISAKHRVCSDQYYIAAIAAIADHISNPTFYIFSDDLTWVKQNLNVHFPIVYAEGTEDEVSEFYLMSRCKHHIISNSSFSWWAAWLYHSQENIVIGPARWLQTKEIDLAALYPAEWLVM